MKSDALIESKSLRESVIDRIDVLDKVKVLAMLPDGIHVTIDMAGNYYEVSSKAIESLIFDNKDELESDGMEVLIGERLSSFKKESQISSRAPSLTIIPRRAILRIGMLLRDSPVAITARSYLLNVEEIARVKAPEIIKEAIEKTSWDCTAISELRFAEEFARITGIRPERVTAIALARIEKKTGEPMSDYRKTLPAVKEEDAERFTPSQLGERLTPQLKANQVNATLEEMGLQYGI